MTTYRYKLTDQNGYTRGKTLWGPGQSYTTSGEGPLCSDAWLHCYCDPLLAVLHNPIHANIKSPRLCLVAVSGEQLREGDTKEGWSKMTFVRWIKLPTLSTTQRIAYGILCAKIVCNTPDWVEWANRWLAGEDRSASAADAAAYTVSADAAVASAADAAAYTVSADAAVASAAYAAAYAVDLDLRAIAKQAMKYGGE